VSRAIQKLIGDGVRSQQVNGIVYGPDGRVVMVDTKRVSLSVEELNTLGPPSTGGALKETKRLNPSGIVHQPLDSPRQGYFTPSRFERCHIDRPKIFSGEVPKFLPAGSEGRSTRFVLASAATEVTKPTVSRRSVIARHRGVPYA
jgi:hypothetical protein